MKNQKLIWSLESVILLSIASILLLLTPRVVLSEQLNNADVSASFNQVADAKAQMLKAEAEAIDAYFSARNMPIYGLGLKMAEEADKNNLDWRLLPAIAIRESTGGKNDCDKATHNFFGWGSCKISFDSDQGAIETVALNLGGNNPNTAKHYAGKTTRQILRAYNPPHVVRRYAEQVLSIMKAIGPEDLGVPVSTSS